MLFTFTLFRILQKENRSHGSQEFQKKNHGKIAMADSVFKILKRVVG